MFSPCDIGLLRMFMPREMILAMPFAEPLKPAQLDMDERTACELRGLERLPQSNLHALILFLKAAYLTRNNLGQIMENIRAVQGDAERCRQINAMTAAVDEVAMLPSEDVAILTGQGMQHICDIVLLREEEIRTLGLSSDGTEYLLQFLREVGLPLNLERSDPRWQLADAIR